MSSKEEKKIFLARVWRARQEVEIYDSKEKVGNMITKVLEDTV